MAKDPRLTRAGASDVTMSTEWTQYRHDLRDIPQQEGFPFNVTYPTKPD